MKKKKIKKNKKKNIKKSSAGLGHKEWKQ
jgi:hypothetical protein